MVPEYVSYANDHSLIDSTHGRFSVCCDYHGIFKTAGKHEENQVQAYPPTQFVPTWNLRLFVQYFWAH